MFWLILLIVVAALCALVLFLVAPAAGRKELRTPFAGRNFAHRGYFGKDQRPPENSLPAFAAAVIIAHQIGTAAQSTIDQLAIAFVISRVVFGILYIQNLPTLRTLVWTLGMALIVSFFVVSA